MIGIVKVNAGISTNGSAEFSLTLVDVQDRLYEVQIDSTAYAQIVGVIEENTQEEVPLPAEPQGNGSNGRDEASSLSPEKRAALAQLLAGKTLQHSVEGEEQPTQSQISMTDVGFDYDYSAEVDDEELDPGELLDEEYVEPI